MHSKETTTTTHREDSSQPCIIAIAFISSRLALCSAKKIAYKERKDSFSIRKRALVIAQCNDAWPEICLILYFVIIWSNSQNTIQLFYMITNKRISFNKIILSLEEIIIDHGFNMREFYNQCGSSSTHLSVTSSRKV